MNLFSRSATGAALATALAVTGVPAMAAPAAEAPVVLTLSTQAAGPTISRHLFGQFAEHLGTGIYGGVWVGPDSPIPNVRGIRKDVVAALKALRVPNVRWPGGCFADKYHWRDGIGPRGRRPVTLNPDWGGVEESNAFGSHEFLDFAQQIGAALVMAVAVCGMHYTGMTAGTMICTGRTYSPTLLALEGDNMGYAVFALTAVVLIFILVIEATRSGSQSVSVVSASGRR